VALRADAFHLVRVGVCRYTPQERRHEAEESQCGGGSRDSRHAGSRADHGEWSDRKKWDRDAGSHGGCSWHKYSGKSAGVSEVVVFGSACDFEIPLIVMLMRRLYTVPKLMRPTITYHVQ